MPRTPDYDPLSDELTPELAAQYAVEQRRQKLAEVLLGHALQPLQAPEVKGRFQGAISPFQGLSQIAQAYMLNKGIEGSQGRMADIGKKVEADKAGEKQRIVDILAAQQPAIAAPSEEQGGGPGRPVMPIDPEERQRRLAGAIVSARYPQNQKIGEFLYSAGEKNIARGDTLEAARQASKDKITAAAEALRVAEEGKAERSQADRNLKVFLAEIAAAMKQSGAGGGTNPYFTPVQTAGGVMAFDARTGKITPVNVGGKPVVGSTSDPVLQGKIAGEKEDAQARAKRAFNMAGLGEVISEAESLLSGTSGKALPTGSTTGTAVDWLGGLVGASPEGAKEAQTLKAIGGALTSKMPRMEGPQSDKDTQLYKEMAAVIGDSTVPRDRRLAALNVVKELWGKYETVNRRSTDKPSAGVDTTNPLLK